MITLPVEQDGDDYIVTFTDDLLEELGWSIGDDLDWDIQSDGSIIVTKHDQETSVGGPSGFAPQVQECLTSYGTPLHDC